MTDKTLTERQDEIYNQLYKIKGFLRGGVLPPRILTT